ncbi:phosphatase domain-containing protein [Psychroflexus aestuariivivens]|uniref:phosphatase domain-containing protein n=1 Tax=Psychroflexus aestuariivivens TaxID=1795040 RepID=UPI000FD8565B|nr:phosphatase domain-containing protein [Psychroflexus aestuariivivens]
MAFLWHLSIIQLDQKTLVTGTVLKNKTSIIQKPKSIFGNSLKVLKSYWKKPYSDRSIYLKSDEKSLSLKTDSKGYFFKVFDAFQSTNFDFYDENGNILEPTQSHPFVFKNKSGLIEIISDIDDTVIHSHTASALKRIYTILFKRPNKRKKVLYISALLDFFEKKDFRIFYLSKSESNLFGLITSIFRFNDVPEGPLLLTPYLKFKMLFKPSKGEHKLKFLRALISNLPQKRFILIGDDTQKDMDIYKQIVNEFEDRIIKVYIRQTGFNVDEIQQSKWESLKNSGVECVYFQDDYNIEEEIQNLNQLISQ